jgi:G:T-mismatch repair DNA endonuclease (very short patch repair protein)
MMTRDIVKPPKEELEEVYAKLNSISKTSKHYSTSNPTVRKWLIEYDIPRLNHKEAFHAHLETIRVAIPSKEELEFIYSTNSINQIEELYEIGQKTVYEWLDARSITRLPHEVKLKNAKTKAFATKWEMTKESLEDDYKKAGSLGVLASTYGCCINTIKKLLKIHGVKTIFPRVSVGQSEVAEFIKSLGFEVIVNDRSIIAPNELDIVVSEKKIAIEYCGMYYHSQTWGGKDRNYHSRKSNECDAMGYRLITLWESEWHTKKEIVKSVIASKLGATKNVVYARNTKFVELSWAEIKKFEEDNHLQGSCPARNYYGLIHNGEIVMTASFGKPRFRSDYDNELVRMTTKIDYSVVGGITKLFKNAKITNCLTYADRRWGWGNGYLNAGFDFLGKTESNYWYFHKSDHDTFYNRTKFQKKRIIGVDSSKTEYANMLEKGYDRIWDCGSNIFGLK